jgi:hypothetical protein
MSQNRQEEKDRNRARRNYLMKPKIRTWNYNASWKIRFFNQASVSSSRKSKIQVEMINVILSKINK